MVPKLSDLRQSLIKLDVADPRWIYMCYIYTLDWIHGKYFVFIIDETSIKNYNRGVNDTLTSFIYTLYYISIKPGRNVNYPEPEDVSLLIVEHGLGKTRDEIFKSAVSYWRNNVN